MKRIYYTLLLPTLLFISLNAVAQSAPEYTGPMDRTISVPAVRFGKQYKIMGDRIGGSGVDTIYIDSLMALNTWQKVMERGNTSDRAAMITGNAEVSASQGLRLEYDQGTNSATIVKSNGLAGVGPSISLGSTLWSINQPASTMSFGTTTIGGNYRFAFSHTVSGLPAARADEFVVRGQVDTILSNADTFSALVGQIAGLGVVTSTIAKRTFGYVTYTNNTGGAEGSGVQIRVGFLAAFPTGVIPVVSAAGTTGQYMRYTLLNLQNNSFIVELQDDIPNGSSISFTYLVKGY